MKFERLWLKAYGPFEDQVLDFGPAAGLQIVYGPNEAGKSSALRAIVALFFGIPAQTPDNFRHDYNLLRVGAVLRLADGRRVSAMRRKGNKATLFAYDPESGRELTEQPLPPDYFAPLLGNVGQDSFLTLFGIDHGRLRTGGRELLEGRGEVGQTLFQAASGLAGVGRLLAELNDSAGELFTPRSRNARLNAAIREYEETQKRLKDALVRPREWKTREAALAAAKARAKALDDEIRELRFEEKRLERLAATIPQIAERTAYARELEELARFPLLALDAGQRRAAEETALANAETAVREAEAVIAAHEAERGRLEISEALLASGPDIDGLRHDLQPAVEAGTKLQRAAALLAEQRNTIAEIGRRLHADAGPESAAGLLPDRAHLARVRSLSSQLAAAAAEAARARQSVQELSGKLEAARSRLDGLPKPRDLSGLAAAVETLKRQGDLEAQAAALDSELEVEARRVAGEVRALGLADAGSLRGLPVPLDGQVDEVRQALDRCREALARLDSEEAGIRRDLEPARAEMTGLEAAGSVVTADRVDAARHERDSQWARIRRTFVEGGADPEPPGRAGMPLDGLPDRYEGAVRTADSLADELRADTARATEYAALAKRVEQMESRLLELAGERLAAVADEAAGRAAWRSRLEGLGLSDRGPEAFKGWLAERRRVLLLIDQHDKRLAERRRLELVLAAARETLAAACREAGLAPPGALPSLAVGLALAANAVDHARKQREARDLARLDVERLELELAQARGESALAEERHGACAAGWREAVAALRLDGSATAAEAEARIEDLERLGTALSESSRLAAEIAAEEAFLEKHRARAARVAAALGLPVPEPGRIGAFTEQRHAELDACRAALRRRDSLAEQLQQERSRLTRERARQAAAAENLARLAAAAGCAERGQLPEAEARSERRRAAEQKVGDIGRQLANQWRLPLESLLAEAEGQSLDSVDARLAELRTQLAEREPLLAEAQQAVADARRDFEAIDGEAHAADIKEELESILARIRRDAESYARIRLARALLDRGIRRFREKAHGPLLAKAEAYFALLTGRNYLNLVVDFEDNRQVLAAERSDGRRLFVEEMSEGTADQLYLALRLAAIELGLEAGNPVPIVLDDVLLAFDDRRAGHALEALASLGEKTQVLLFTHHRHLVRIAEAALPAGSFGLAELAPGTFPAAKPSGS